jgi:positive regulator of sigma E activity
MDNANLTKNRARVLSILAIIVPLTTFITMVFGFLHAKTIMGITPRFTLLMCMLGIIVAFISKKMFSSKLGKISLIITIVLTILNLIPFLYFIVFFSIP